MNQKVTLLTKIDPTDYSAAGNMQIRRQKLHEPTVEKYAVKMLGVGPVPFPPIKAVRNPTGDPLNKFVVYDGHHRLAALARAEDILREHRGEWNGVTEVPMLDAEILEGKFNVNQILCLAYRANEGNGLAIGKAETKRYFHAFIDSRQYQTGIERAMTLRDLGKMFGVSYNTIKGWLIRDHKRVWEQVYSRDNQKQTFTKGRTGLTAMQKNLWDTTEESQSKLVAQWLELKSMGSTQADAAIAMINANTKIFEALAVEAGLKADF